MRIREAIQLISRICFVVGNEEDEHKCRRYQKALKIAISAMKRHQAKSILPHKFAYGQCPTCKVVYEDNEPNKYCGNCGQKLKRSE